MVAKLSSRGGAAPAAQQRQEERQPAAGGNGWGNQGETRAAPREEPRQEERQPAAGANGWGQQGGGAAGGAQQREAVSEAIQPRESIRGAFTGGVQEQAGAIAGGDYGETAGGGAPFTGGRDAPADPAPKATRTRKPKDPAPAETEDNGFLMHEQTLRKDVLVAVLAGASPDDEVDDLIEITDALMAYVLTGAKA